VVRTLGVLQALLLAELWWLWPWQLQVLEAAAEAQDAADAAFRAEQPAEEAGKQPNDEAGEEVQDSSSRRGSNDASGIEEEEEQPADGAGEEVQDSSSKRGSGDGSGSEDEEEEQPADGAGEEVQDSSSRRGSGDGSGSEEEEEEEEEEAGQGFCDTFLDRPMSGLLLTPRLVAAEGRPQLQGPKPAPVSQQELQLVLGLMTQAAGPICGAAALLLVLLLQRADREVRVAFLNGPEGSLLLATLMAWGARPDNSSGRGAPIPWQPYREEVGDWRMAHYLMKEALGGTEEARANSKPLEAGAFAAAVLAMCFLEPVPGHELNLQRPCRWVVGQRVQGRVQCAELLV
jgi:hypothetical protein